MTYPLLSEYIESIKSPADFFDQLKHLRPVLNDDGTPVMTSGNFAVVFKMKDEESDQFYAVKCFLRDQERRSESYRLISEQLKDVDIPYLTSIKYLENEIYVNTTVSQDKEYPVLIMDWVEGKTLDAYIREHIDDQYELSMLAYRFSQLAMWLLPQPFAHGDLKPENILVKDDGSLVLVDYDGMYVPAMKGQLARELGSPDFRHPLRTDSTFNEHIDDFSVVSILLSLKAIAVEPSLLGQFSAPDRLLFSVNDYFNLNGSAVLRQLYTIDDSELKMLCSVFTIALQMQDISFVSSQLLNIKEPIGYRKKRVYGTSSGHEYVDLGLSVKWATCNVGATKPEEYGDYYAWGETDTKNDYALDTYKHYYIDYSSEEFIINKYDTSGDNGTTHRVVLYPEDDIAHINFGKGWRMPTKAEQEELCKECTWKWYDCGNSEFGGIAGYKITSNKFGYTDRFIFLPAAGYCREEKTFFVEERGLYWSSSLNTDDDAWVILFDKDYNKTSFKEREIGISVRPVCTL